MEFTQIVTVQATNDMEIGRKVRAIKNLAEETIVLEPSTSTTGFDPKEPRPSPIDIIVPEPIPAPAQLPYFDVGEATGEPGQTVEVSVEAGCEYDITGFHIGGGLSGYGKFRAVGAKLGPYFQRYLRAEDAKLHDKVDEVGDHYFSKFNFVRGRAHRALPTEWWEFLVGLLSLEHRKLLGSVTVPAGTDLFTLQIEILPGTPPGEYELTCKDEWYYTNSRGMRRKFLWTADTDSPFARGGVTKIKTLGGVLTVT